MGPHFIQLPLLLGLSTVLSVGAAQASKHGRGLQTASIAGHVYSFGGHGVSAASVTALAESGGTVGQVTSGSGGQYTFDGLPDGTYRVDFDVPGFDLTRHNRVRVRQGTTAAVNATVYPSSICECIAVVHPVPLQSRAGQVVDEAGRPLAHAQLTAFSPVRAEVAYADGEGRFAVRLPIKGTWPLTASDAGFAAATLHLSGIGAEPILFVLKRADTTSIPDSNRFSRGCRCAGDLFTHEGR